MNIIFYLLLYLFLFFCGSLKSQNMMFIRGGEYNQFFNNTTITNEPVFVNDFYINKYHITNLDYFIFILNNSEWDILNIKNIFSDDSYLNHWKNNINFLNFLNFPITNVSWFSSNAYCIFFNYRLPKIDEWEYIVYYDKCFNSNNSEYWKNILNFYINSQYINLISVYNMPTNSLGIVGFHGFVWEWVEDFNSIILLNTDAEGGGLEELLYCGASTINAIDPSDYVAFMRFAFRNSLEANYTMNKLGFRCVKDVKF